MKIASSGRYEDALNAINLIKKENKENPFFFNTLGIIYRRLKEYREAEKACKKALSLMPGFTQAQVNLASVYLEREDLNKAIALLQSVLKKRPEYPEALSNLAYAFKKMGNYSEAESNYGKCLRLNPNLANATFNYGLTLLTLGKFKEGSEKYEYRWKVDPGDKVVWPLKDKALWDGKSGSKVLLWREQGIGDDIIFLGLVPEAYEVAGKAMSVLIDPRLIPICERSMPGIEFLPAAKGLSLEDRFDYQLPMGSLPRLFRNSEEDFNRTRKSYFKADLARVEQLRKELGVEGRKVIGISWKSFKSLNTTKKSMDLDQFGRMFKDCNVALLNLQYGEVDEEIREFKESTGIDVLQSSSVDLREDLDGLAALIELCDLVVSTSNVTIHMAGALGKDSWVLLPFAANFWWLIERTDSLWYPTIRLYRQKSLQDWSEILEVIRSDLDQRFDKL